MSVYVLTNNIDDQNTELVMSVDQTVSKKDILLSSIISLIQTVRYAVCQHSIHTFYNGYKPACRGFQFFKRVNPPDVPKITLAH